MKLKLDLHDIYNRGQDIDRALQAIIDEAVAKKAPLVEIIPGKGSGQLKKRVLRFLDQKEIKALYHRVEKDSKNYGRLSKSIKTMGSQISWGLPILKVIRTFANSVDSWITMAIGTLMVEVIDVGGGTVNSFSQMADFTRKVNELEADKRSSLRSYVFVVYMAGIMLVLTTFMMVYFLSTPITFKGAVTPTPGLTIDPATVQLLLTASIFDGWVIGFVAGKMGGGTVADGFKHSLALVVVGGMMVAFSGLFLGHAL